MTQPYDPTGRGTGAGSPGQATSGPTPTASDGSSGSTGDLIPRADHERALEQERRRQSGQTRAYEKKIADLQRRLEDLESLSTSGRPASSASAASTLSDDMESLLSRINPDDPAVAAIRASLSRTQRLEETLLRRDREERDKREYDAAFQEASRLGIPDGDLDDSSTAALRASIEEWRKNKRIQDLEEEVKKLRREGEQTETRTRDELGATRVSTLTGQAPLGVTVDTQIEEVDRVISKIKEGIDPDTGGRLGDANRVVQLHRANRARLALLDWKRDHPRGDPHPVRAVPQPSSS